LTLTSFDKMADNEVVSTKTPDRPLVFTRSEVMRLLKLGHTTIDRMVASGVLDSRKIGGARRILASSVDALLEKKERE
jgi:excisionase family DNA binding protein